MPEENLYTKDCIRTFTGLYMNVFNPAPEMIRIEDIAHSLSMQCRFGGHLPRFFSVAQHSIEVCEMADKPHKLQALLHDASEAYLLDLPRPIKNNMKDYKFIENKLMIIIGHVFGFDWRLHSEVKKCDEVQLEYEWRGIMLNQMPDKICLSRNLAKQKFLKLFKQLIK